MTTKVHRRRDGVVDDEIIFRSEDECYQCGDEPAWRIEWKRYGDSDVVCSAHYTYLSRTVPDIIRAKFIRRK